MDGTFVNLYGVENWLDYLINEDITPYEIAKPLFNMSLFARLVNKLQREGWEIGIITWLSKNATNDYNMRVAKAKRESALGREKKRYIHSSAVSVRHKPTSLPPLDILL